MANKLDTQKFDVTGMHCASCASIIKRKLGKLPGVESADVNLATETAELRMSKDVPITKLNAEVKQICSCA